MSEQLSSPMLHWHTRHVQLWSIMAERTGIDGTTLHYLVVWWAMECTQTRIFDNLLLYLANWPLDTMENGFQCQGSPSLGFAQTFSALTVWKKCQNEQNTAVDYATTCMGTSTICLCSSKSSLPSLYPLHHLYSSPHTMYTAVESWVKLGNEASAIED